jgi:hypothetical protein
MFGELEGDVWESLGETSKFNTQNSGKIQNPNFNRRCFLKFEI